MSIVMRISNTIKLVELIREELKKLKGEVLDQRMQQGKAFIKLNEIIKNQSETIEALKKANSSRGVKHG
jgi:hypothetical protein